MSDDWTGIHPHGTGWRAVVSRGRGHAPVRQWFPAETPLSQIQQWRAEQKADTLVTRKRRATRGTFANDAKRYLDAVKTLPTFKERKQHIQLWVAVFKTKARDTITAADIRTVRERWLTEPRSSTDKRPLKPHTVNLRLRALSNLYKVLDGSQAHNPVRDVDEAPEPTEAARAVPYEAIRQVLDKLPDRGRPSEGQRPRLSLTKIRLRCLAYSQITPKQLSQITKADLDLTRGRLRLPARAKGKGAEAIWVTLLPDALDAFRDFDAQKLYGKFSWGSLSKSWHRAVKKADVGRFTPYQLRHTFGTMVYRATRSREAVQQLLQHASWATSRRYVLEAETDVRQGHESTVAAFFQGQHSGTTGPPEPSRMPQKTAEAKVAGRQKRRAGKAKKARK